MPIRIEAPPAIARSSIILEGEDIVPKTIKAMKPSAIKIQE
jgi:hypothetical protein